MIVFNKSPVSFVNLNNKRYFNDNKVKPQQKPLFEKIIENLEQFPKCQFGNIPLNYGIDDRLLPAVGSTIPVTYRIDAAELSPELTATTEWQVLGYNKSIPSRVKYKNGNDRIYVPTTNPSGLLAAIAAGTSVYADKSSTTAIGTVTDVALSIIECPGNTINGVGHTYGNNCPYDAPTSVTVGGKEYTFAGWNMTIQTKNSLAVRVIYNSTTYLMQIACYYGTHGYASSSLVNRWVGSPMRKWLNLATPVPKGKDEYNYEQEQPWYHIDGDTGKRFSNYFKGILGRFPDTSLLDAVIPTVNRTWVHPQFQGSAVMDSNYCEHAIDNFWLLGAGNVSLTGTTAEDYFPDVIYDTSKFSDVFIKSELDVNNTTRSKDVMGDDGASSGLNPGWFLRSARSGTGNYNLVAAVYQYGGIANTAANVRMGIAPACTIG